MKAWNEAGALVKPKGITIHSNGPGEFEMQSCVYHLQTPESDGNHFSNEASKISCYHVIHQAIPQWGISLSWWWHGVLDNPRKISRYCPLFSPATLERHKNSHLPWEYHLTASPWPVFLSQPFGCGGICRALHSQAHYQVLRECGGRDSS